METYEVLPLTKIDYTATGIEEVLQNVAFILATMKFDCPMDRVFGWEPSVDAPLDQAEAENTHAILEAITEFEPRAIVTEINVEKDPFEGYMKIKVKVGVEDGSI